MLAQFEERGYTVTIYSLDFWAGCRLDISVLEGHEIETWIFKRLQGKFIEGLIHLTSVDEVSTRSQRHGRRLSFTKERG
jgi:hypothetical protein